MELPVVEYSDTEVTLSFVKATFEVDSSATAIELRFRNYIKNWD